MKDKKIYIIFIISILLTLVGVSLAYFSLKVVGNENAKINKVITGNLELTYTDTSEISLNNAVPGNTIEKVIKVTNTGTKEVSYNIGWTDYINEITNNELVIEGTCKNLNSSNTEEGTCNGFRTKAITGSNILSNISIEPNITHEYTLKITFKETNKPQNYNKNKSFTGKINITESTAKTVYCTFDGELVQGVEYINGQYTYRYKQEGTTASASSGIAWSNITTDGWGVQLTDKTSTEPVNSELCTYINDKPIVSMSYMFYISKATTLDVSKFDTSNVNNMDSMFYNSQATTLDLKSFNTRNVTNMNSMFYGSQATTLDVGNFDTSNVTNMQWMFYNSKATILDLNSFDTSNVTVMTEMFLGIKTPTLDLSSFDTSKVKVMSRMFYGSESTIINLSSFDTSNVTNMRGMFSQSNVESLDLSSFDTSKVIYMDSMFESSNATTIDLSSFDTSKVTNMSYMFYDATKLKTIYVSSKYNTDAVTSSSGMFRNCTSLAGGYGTVYDESNVDKTYARIDGGTTSPGYFTTK